MYSVKMDHETNYIETATCACKNEIIKISPDPNSFLNYRIIIYSKNKKKENLKVRTQINHFGEAYNRIWCRTDSS